MHYIVSPANTTVSYSTYGNGSPLVLVHGSFSDHNTNWKFVKPFLEQQFTVYAVARRGRGKTDTTEGHIVEDESIDIAALIQTIDEPVFLLGHSYGAHVALATAIKVPNLVRKLVLYEAPSPRMIDHKVLERLEALAQIGDWDSFALTFFRDQLFVPIAELDQLRMTELWSSIVADAEASLGDMRSLSKYDFNAEHFSHLQVPVLLQIGTESPRDLYVTDALAAVLPDVRIEALLNQAHEGMTTAPEMYAETVSNFLLG